ncbi:class I SAM-dependent methyltransferase [Methylobacter sp. Wu1]|uniref:class I SAM-dependent methyltransferase n=1 Tax=Methylobacter sp. Wu1 TaxID=3119359 RepID=UPI002F940385
MLVAEWRHVQSIHEPTELRNPDTLVGHFLPALRRWRLSWLGQRRLDRLRSDPFYYYLIARTKYYDEIFLDAVANNVRYIINVGCGSDTRAYRFGHVLRQHGVKVLECDKSEVITNKERMAKRWRRHEDIAYRVIDLNDDTWPDFEDWLSKHNTDKTLILMEGVSPYVNKETFGRFLTLLAKSLPPESRVAYDYKLYGVADDFGRVERTQKPFRLPKEVAEVVAYHDEFGYRVIQCEQSSSLTNRFLADLIDPETPVFMEDNLVQLEVR